MYMLRPIYPCKSSKVFSKYHASYSGVKILLVINSVGLSAAHRGENHSLKQGRLGIFVICLTTDSARELRKEPCKAYISLKHPKY